MRKKIFLQILLFLFMSQFVFSQRDLQKEADFIKSANNRYYWGEGTGRNTSEADAVAMGMLSEQIDVNKPIV